MTILPIRVAPDPVLKVKCEKVETVTDEDRRLLDDMLATMYDAPGIGLAAPQVGVTKRMIVVDVSGPDKKEAPLKLINPEITWSAEEMAPYEEGCLSFPEQYAEVKRPAEVEVVYLDENGEKQTLRASGLLSTCIQHEIDHLDGINFVDHISKLKRDMVMRRLQKWKKQHSAAAE